MDYNSPKEIAVAYEAASIDKVGLPMPKFCINAAFGGAFIAFGGLLSVMVAGGMPGIGEENPGLINFIAGALFPVGLIMVTLTGADLFTGNCAGLTLPLLRKELKATSYLRVLLVSFIFNFLGAQFIAFLLSANAGFFAEEPWHSYLHDLAIDKMNLGFWEVFVLAIAANWLVCLAVWMGYAAKDVSGTCIANWIPVMLFVTLGYEHSVANMFFIPAAIYSGAPIAWGDFMVQNLLPATLGNIIGGALLVACAYWYVYLNETPDKQ